MSGVMCGHLGWNVISVVQHRVVATMELASLAHELSKNNGAVSPESDILHSLVHPLL